MKSISPWKQTEECPVIGFQDFKRALIDASFHHAGPSGEWRLARNNITIAANIAITEDWPYWAMERMFKEISPLVEWDQFMQSYINCLKNFKNVDNEINT
jgi:hypothetical protein